MTRDDKVIAMLAELFKLTGAAFIEIHSGDREPGHLFRRDEIMKLAGKQAVASGPRGTDV